MPHRRSQVTTKRGDHGETTALSGDHYSKSHPIMECSGAVDEARAQTALARQLVLLSDRPESAEAAGFLYWLLHAYFLIGAACSDPTNRHPGYRAADIGPEHLERLERYQARLEEQVTLPKAFIVSASNPLAAQMDLTATYARRLERSLVRLKEAIPEFDTTHLFPFINRLSDTLFMLARSLDAGDYQTVNYDVLKREV
jgi:cob(I)alamin adenosyltransferase